MRKRCVIIGGGGVGPGRGGRLEKPFSERSLYCRGGSRNSLKGGVLGQNSSKGGGVRVQVRGNFHNLTSKKKKKKL